VLSKMTTATKSGRQRRIKMPGQPPPVWPWFMQQAAKRIGQKSGFKKKPDAIEQIAAEIVRHGDGEKFLKAVRRGRPTQQQNIRYRLMREVEQLIGPSVPRRREDRNTPDRVRQISTVKLEPA
jgi:hypothetical protein